MTDQDLDLDRLEALANQKRGRGYREEQTLIGAVPPLVAEVRRLREAITEFAKQHGIGDATSRPLYDAQQQLADAKSEIERLRVVERELDGQRLELAAAWETTCEAVGVDTDSTLGEWQTAFDERVAHYHASGYKAGKRDALEEAARAALEREYPSHRRYEISYEKALELMEAKSHD